MNWDIQHIFMTLPISGVTINNVFLSPEFRIILYLLIAVILTAGTLYFTTKNFTLPDAFKKAVIIAFFASGLLYAIHADIGWTSWIITDVKKYWGLSTEDKLRTMDDGLYEFSLQAKKILDDDYQLYSSNKYMAARAQYYLLPLHRREQAPYIVVIADNEARFDHLTRIFTRGEKKIADVRPVLFFARNAYILKRP
jgi:hypothetical protein